MKKIYDFVVRASSAPVVTVDNEASAIYVRFDRVRKYARTVEVFCGKGGVITLDLDKQNNVLGIEAIGVGEVSLQALMEKARVEAPRVDLSKARFGAFTPEPAALA